MNGNTGKIGFTCAYTPLVLIEAAGYTPYRVLPMGDCPDQAGRLLHDNLCPHVKRILDRAFEGDVPSLTGMVFMNSCDAMRRLADAWTKVRGHERVILLDLPVVSDGGAISFFATELDRLRSALSEWSGRTVSVEAIETAIERYNELAYTLADLRDRAGAGVLNRGSREVQEIYNLASTEPMWQTLDRVRQILADSNSPRSTNDRVPVFLFGNVLPEPDAFDLFESCGVHISDDDLCTGSRMFSPIENGSEDVLTRLAAGLLSRPGCARTLQPASPCCMADDIVARAKACNARGVIGHVAKFCDPYLGRMPRMREALRDAGLPLLLLEGDCTLRSIGQQRTRIEAFAEMLR